MDVLSFIDHLTASHFNESGYTTINSLFNVKHYAKHISPNNFKMHDSVGIRIDLGTGF